MLSTIVALVAAALPLALADGASDNVPVEARAATPQFSHDGNTTPHCSFWYDHDGSMSCGDVLSIFDVSLADFTRWNPSITSACDNFVASKSYCIEAAGEPSPSNRPEPGPPTSSPTSTSPGPPSPADPIIRPANGIETPRPTQPDLVDNCSKFYWVRPGDQCGEIAHNNGIALQDFLAWNPKAGQSCNVLWADAYACVSVLGHKPQPTASKAPPSNGIQTPVPTQPGMVGNCARFQYVNSGESCVEVARKGGVSVLDLVRWNPRAGSDCHSLWANAYACVGVLPA